MTKPLKKLDDLPEDIKPLAECLLKLLGNYLPGEVLPEILVGRSVSAQVTIKGGPITRDVLDDIIAHLVFYKRYFPKTPEEDTTLSSPEKILEALANTWKDHEEKMKMIEQEKQNDQTH